MNITVNNEVYELAEGSSLEAVIGQLQIPETKGIALALNEEIIPKSEWQKVNISEGDKIIIIGAVAGG
jgi:sulfur carrier protein